MTNILDLQGLPDAIKPAASAVLQGGSCVSVVSIVTGGAVAAVPGDNDAKIQAAGNVAPTGGGLSPMGGSCVSVVSYVGGGSAI